MGMGRFPAWRRAASVFACLLALLGAGAAAAATTYSWTGTASALWSNPNNWSPIGTPAAGDTLAFPSGPSILTVSNDLSAGTSFAGVVFNGGGYTVNGNGFALAGNMTGSAVVNVPVAVQASSISVNAQSFTAGLDGGAHTFSLGFSSFAGSLSGSGTISLSGTLTGSHPFSGTLSLTGNTT